MENSLLNTAVSIIGFFVLVLLFSFIADFSRKKIPFRKRLILSAVLSLVIVIILRLL